MAEIIHLDRKCEEEFLEVVNIFQDNFPAHPSIQEMYLNPQKYIDKTIACKEYGKILGGLRRGFDPNFDAMVINFLAVREDSRDKGIGAILLNNLESFAKEKGINQIRLKPRDNHRTFNFYKKNGYEMDRSLLGNGWMFKMLG